MIGGILGALALVGVCVVCIAVVRAKREHESIMTVLHAELAHLESDFDTLKANLEDKA